MHEITDQEEQIAFSEGLLEGWIKDAPKQILEALQILSSGVKYYREKYTDIQEDYEKLQTMYNALVVQSAQHLKFAEQQKQLLDEYLIESQREFSGPAKEEARLYGKPTIEI